MIIAIGCDHSALDLKNLLAKYLIEKGHEIVDCGTYTYESCDYTDYGLAVAQKIEKNEVECGIVICYTGIGMSIIANKVKGVRCALVHNKDAAQLTREHNDTNCLALSAKYTGFAYAKEIVDIWLDTPFSNNERHERRINKITQYDEER